MNRIIGSEDYKRLEMMAESPIVYSADDLLEAYNNPNFTGSQVVKLFNDTTMKFNFPKLKEIFELFSKVDFRMYYGHPHLYPFLCILNDGENITNITDENIHLYEVLPIYPDLAAMYFNMEKWFGYRRQRLWHHFGGSIYNLSIITDSTVNLNDTNNIIVCSVDRNSAYGIVTDISLHEDHGYKYMKLNTIFEVKDSDPTVKQDYSDIVSLVSKYAKTVGKEVNFRKSESKVYANAQAHYLNLFTLVLRGLTCGKRHTLRVIEKFSNMHRWEYKTSRDHIDDFKPATISYHQHKPFENDENAYNY